MIAPDGKRLIEFLGPSGIGKTTFLKKINHIIPCYYNINKFNSVDINLLPKYINPKLECFYREVLTGIISQLISSKSLKDLPVLMRHFARRIVADAIFVSSDSGFHIVDEGLFHLFFRTINNLLENKKYHHDAFNCLLENRFIICLRSSKEGILSNLFKRNSTEGNIYHNDHILEYGIEKTKKNIDVYLQQQNIFLEILHNFNFNNVIYINLDEDFAKNINTIKQILGDL